MNAAAYRPAMPQHSNAELHNKGSSAHGLNSFIHTAAQLQLHAGGYQSTAHPRSPAVHLVAGVHEALGDVQVIGLMRLPTVHAMHMPQSQQACSRAWRQRCTAAEREHAWQLSMLWRHDQLLGQCTMAVSVPQACLAPWVLRSCSCRTALAVQLQRMHMLQGSQSPSAAWALS